MPEYYIMKYNLGMAETIKNFMPSEMEILKCKWLTDKDILIYVNSFTKKAIIQNNISIINYINKRKLKYDGHQL